MTEITGRASAEIASQLRQRISDGQIAAGQFLPPERTLSEEHGVARKTVRRAMRTLEDEGLVATVPRRGYRVLSRTGDPNGGAPLAYIARIDRPTEEFTLRYRTQMDALRLEASRRGWSILMVTSTAPSRGQLVGQAVSAGAAGMILDTEDEALIRKAVETGIPAVMVDAWNPNVAVDCVMQDGHQGGLLAAKYLADRGHKRVAVIVPRVSDAHSTDRFGGAVAGLARAGLELPPELMLLSDKKETVRPGLVKMLERSDRPTAFIALWTGMALEVVETAREMGMEYGRDYEVVGWSVEEVYDELWAAHFDDHPVPPAITWSMKTMARTAITRLTDRRADPSAPALRMKIPVTLRPGSKT